MEAAMANVMARDEISLQMLNSSLLWPSNSFKARLPNSIRAFKA